MVSQTILDRFIVFEGIDGSGKTTQLERVSKTLQSKGVLVYSTREPYSGSIGKYIRERLSNHTQANENDFETCHQKTGTKRIEQQESSKLSTIANSDILAYLFAADRYEHLYAEDGILALHAKSMQIIISDRYLFSSLAYQKHSNIENLTFTLNMYFPMPKILYYFDISPQKALSRMQTKQKDTLENFKNLSKVRDNYLQLISEYKKSCPEMQIIVIDADTPPEQITDTIVAHIQEYLQANH